MKDMKKIIALLLAMIMLLCCFAGCGGDTADDAADDGAADDAGDSSSAGDNSSEDEGGEKILTTAVTAAWDTLAPHVTTYDVGNFIAYMHYESLMGVGMDGVAVPRLASSWDWSEDGKAITFHINENANWTDGTPVTATDVIFSCQMLSNKDYNSRSVYLTYVDGTDDSGYELSSGSVNVVAEDDKTVTFYLKDAIDESILFSNLKRIWIIPEHVFGDMDPATIRDSERWSEDIVTCGAFIYDTQISGEQIEFVANEDYFLGAPKVDRIVIKVMTPAAMAAALVAGEIDFTAGANVAALNYSDYETLEAADNVNLQAVQTYAFQYLACDWGTYPLEVRQALSLGINRQAIIDNVLLGNGEPLITQYTSISDYYLPELYEGENIGYDPVKAKELLDQAGWDYNEEIIVYYHSGNNMREQTCLMIQQNWQALGLNVSLQAQETPSMMSGLGSGEFKIGTMGQSGDSTSYNYLDLYMPGHPVVDMSHLTTTYYLDTMTEMKFMTNLDDVIAKCEEVQMKMLEEIPYIYLYSPYTLQGCSSNVTGFNMADANAYFWPCWQWDVA